MYIFDRQGNETVFWDVFVWADSPNYVPTDEDYENAIIAPRGRAFNPSPADEALYEDTWVTLSWKPGDSAVSHDVYFGENFDDVNDGTGDTYQGNQTGTFLVVGFPGFAYPEGLVPGTTYYWRVDEVNDLNPNSPWKGFVWSFTVPSRTAYDPDPADGAKFVEPDADLSWTAGFGGKVHTVYFGENFDDVNDAVAGLPQATTAYTPGPLELEKTYYWRVDEFDGLTTHKGHVWSFTTAKAGGGIKGEYFNNMNLSGLPALTRIDPQIDFYWNPGPDPPPGVNEDNFSVRWTGELEAAFSEPVTFITGSDDGVRLYLDGELIIDNWTDHDRTENRSDPIELVAGQTYSMVLEGYDNTGEAEWQLYWRSPSIPRQLIPQAALSPPVKASSPNPRNGAVDVRHTAILSWGAGDHAASHQVYFGDNEDAVKNATTGSPQYKGSRALGSESYDPGKLAWHTTYYWRVDGVNNVHPDSPWIGNVWSFTTADFLIVDDFESYNDLDPGDPDSNRIFLTWIDGYEQPTNGSQVGYLDPPFCEQSIVHGGSQSMPLFYDNSGPAYYSEATLPLSDTRDWTEEGVGVLTLWFRGNPAGFVEAPVGTYTMTASGVDIWGTADEFRYAWKQLSGNGSIVAQVLSVEDTDPWAKTGVMIRETLEPGSKFAAVYITPGNGCRFQLRAATGGDGTSDTSVVTTEQTGITAPYWVKLERTGNQFNAYYSSNPATDPWHLMVWSPRVVSMNTNVYIGLALTSHNPDATCVAEFSDVTTTGTVTPMMWTHEAIGAAMVSNDPEPMYVALNGSAVVYHDNPDAALIDTWTQWNIDLAEFSNQGVVLTNVDTLSIGFGDRNNPQLGGSGMVLIDDIRLYRLATEP